jgi:hypothetical protein
MQKKMERPTMTRLSASRGRDSARLRDSKRVLRRSRIFRIGAEETSGAIVRSRRSLISAMSDGWLNDQRSV